MSTENRLRFLFFDLDDTLLDFGLGEAAAFERCLVAAGLEYSEITFTTYCAINRGLWSEVERQTMTVETLRIERFRLLIEHMKWTLEPHHLRDGYERHLEDSAHRMDGALELCQRLSQRGVGLGIISNGIERLIEQRLVKAGLRSYFQPVISSQAFGSAKPDPRIFHHALSLAGISPDQAMIVGDRPDTDIAGGIAAGMSTCWFNRHGLASNPVFQPTWEIQHLSELPERLGW